MNLRIAITILLLNLSFQLTNAEDWLTHRGNCRRTGRTIEILSPPLQVVQEFSVGSPIFSSPSVEKGIVYFGARDNFIYAVKADTLIWKYKTNAWVDASPLLSDGILHISSRDGNLYSISVRTGIPLAKHNTGGKDVSSPLLDEERYGVTARTRIFTGSGFPNKYIYSITIRETPTGTSTFEWKEDWRIPTEQYAYSSPALFRENIYVGANDGKYYCISKNGELKWSVQTQGLVYFSTPAISEDGILYVAPGDYDRNIYAFDAERGNLIWKYSVPGTGAVVSSSCALGDSTVYVVSGAFPQSLYALNSKTGSLIWSKPIGNSTPYGFSSSPLVSGNTVYVGTGDGNLLAFDAESGIEIQRLKIGDAILSSPAISEGILYVGTLDGKMISLKHSSSENASVYDNTPISIYPNPAKIGEEIHLSLTPDAEAYNNTPLLKIYNLLGQKVLTQNIFSSNPTIKIKNLPEGIYFYVLSFKDGKQTKGKFLLIK